MSIESDYHRKAAAFYERNYRLRFTFEQVNIASQKKRILRGPEPRCCRFCGRGVSQVTFGDVAHAVPESIGNRRLISEYECDTCNRFFGSSIENHFGNWSKPNRLLAGRRGKTGIPTLKGGGPSGWRIERTGNRFEIFAGANEDDRPFTASEDHRVVNLSLTRDPYVPVAVLKTFVKMALSVMPDEEFANFGETRDWLMGARTGDDFIQIPSAEWLVATSTPADSFAIHLLTRKHNAPDRVPYAYLLLSYGNQRFQVNIPCPLHDVRLPMEAHIVLAPFPWPDAAEDVLHAGEIDLYGTDPVRDDTINVTYTFETAEASRLDHKPTPTADEAPD
ncbi:HNH endonuclease [Burkholderia contaminans]|uniref:HNH endonuclease n=1 Tax=Burkholderia contaminans TaxID=488447 RepID=UPI001CF5C7BC|nr:HNH endonuclease [Burkholderia contaminans]MCA7888596.1 HNH endonuclease [Burkholderia contaminans]